MDGEPEAIVLRDLLTRQRSSHDESDWMPYLPGIDVRWLYETPAGGPAAALLRYQPGARAPRHEHLGYEHVLVLDGAQSDDFGHYPAGTFVVNRPGSVHEVSSATGCIVLITWERRVRFLAAGALD